MVVREALHRKFNNRKMVVREAYIESLVIKLLRRLQSFIIDRKITYLYIYI